MFEGVISNLDARYRETDSDYVRKELEEYMQTLICPACNGRRLRPEALAVRFADKSIADMVSMPIDEASLVFSLIAKNPPKATHSGGRAVGICYAPCYLLLGWGLNCVLACESLRRIINATAAVPASSASTGAVSGAPACAWCPGFSCGCRLLRPGRRTNRGLVFGSCGSFCLSD
jgi:hypothetical protein